MRNPRCARGLDRVFRQPDEGRGILTVQLPEFRAYALAALAAMDQTAAHTKLRHLMDSPEMQVRYGAFNAFDPEQNIHAGARYLADLIARFGGEKLELVLAAYNAGEDAVEKYGRRIPPYKETQAYVPNVLRMYRALRAQALGAEPGTES